MRPRTLPTSRFPLFAVAIAVAALLNITAPARAQWSSSGSTNTQLSTFTSLSGIPAVYPDHAGGAVFAWSDARGAIVQRLDAFGFKMWGTTGIVISNTNQLFAMTKSISDDAGGVIVGWSQNGPAPGFYVQHVDRLGTPLWGVGGINLTATGNVSKLCSDGAGGVIAVWTQVSGSQTQIYVNRVSAAGVVQWGASGKLVHASNDLKTINLLVPSSGSGAIVGWYNFLMANLSDPDTLFFQRVDGSGNPQWPTPGAPTFVRVITLDDTQVELACTGNAGAAYYTTQRADSMFLHLLQPAGTFTSPVAGWAIAGPTTAKVKLGLAKYMIEDGAGGVVIAWRDESYGGSIFGRIRAQRLNATGQRQWPAPGGTFVEVCGLSNDQSMPGILRDAFGNYLFGWEDYRNNVNINLWSQKLDGTTGAQQWAPAGVFFASATDNQFAPRFAAGNPGNAIAGFDDARTGQERMYAQFVGPLGVLTPANTVPMSFVAPAPVARSAAGYTSVGGALFVNGGGSVNNVAANTLASYTAGTNTWATVGTYLSRWFGSLTYVPETDKFYAMNGYDNAFAYMNSVEEIAPGGGAANLMTINPLPREGSGVAALGGKIYVIGGTNNVVLGGSTGLVRVFDAVTNTWSSTVPALPVPTRVGMTAVAYNGSIFVVGGNASTGPSKLAHRYDVGTNTWSAVSSAPLPIAYQASAVTGGLIWFAGDLTNGWTLMSYAPATDTWTMHTTNMLSRRGAALGAVGNTLIVSGGSLGQPMQDVLETQTSDVSVLVAATPLASVTLPVSALANTIELGDAIFAAPAESTLVTINFASVAGAGTATVARYPGPAANVSFSAAAPTSVGTTRWVMSESGLSPFSGTVSIQLFGLPDALGAWSGITIYRRVTAGSGAFAPLSTSFDAATGRVSAVVDSLGEFILGSGGAVDVAGGGVAPLALGIRALGANPVRGALAFELTLPVAGAVRVEVFDVQGRVVASRGVTLSAGVHAVGMGNGRAVVAPGLYFARVAQGGRVAMGRVVVVE